MNPKQAPATLVLIHGLLGSPLEFALASQILKARGLDFDLLQVPGYSHGAGPEVLDWHHWLKAAGEAIDARYGADVEIVLGGIGVGGGIAASLALEARRQRVRGVVMLSPNFDEERASGGTRALQGVASVLGFDKRMSIPLQEPYGIKNPKIRKWVMRELEEHGTSSIGPGRLPLRGIREGERLMAHLKPSMEKLAAPLLVLHAREDDTTPVSSVERWVATVGSNARLIVLEHSYHRIAIDNDRQRVAHEMADFAGAAKRTRATPPAASPQSEPSKAGA